MTRLTIALAALAVIAAAAAAVILAIVWSWGGDPLGLYDDEDET